MGKNTLKCLGPMYYVLFKQVHIIQDFFCKSTPHKIWTCMKLNCQVDNTMCANFHLTLNHVDKGILKISVFLLKKL